MPKIKHNIERKIKVVNEFLSERAGRTKLSEKYGVLMSDITKWVDAYTYHGVDGLKIRQYDHQKYDSNFKISVVEYKKEHNLSSRKTVAYFNIPSYTTVNNWE